MIRTHQLEIAGVWTVVREAGPTGSSEAVVLVHGNPGSSRDWEGLLDVVGPLGRAVAWDAPGFGRADKPDLFDQTVQGHAAFIDAALEALGVDRVHLVAHDFGGPWGLAWAAAHPDRLASVVLINSGVLRDYHWHYLARIWRTPRLGEAFMATSSRWAFGLLLKHGNPRGLPERFVDRMYDDFDAGTRRAVLRLYRATDQPSDVGPLSATLRATARPALVVWGAKDPYIPLSFAQQQRETFPDAEVVVLEDSGHWPFADNPARVGELVEAFYRRVLTPS